MYGDQSIFCTLVSSAIRKAWVDVAEMKAFISVLIVMGLCRRFSYRSYWSTNWLLDMPGFRSILPRDRFFAILRFLHLAAASVYSIMLVALVTSFSRNIAKPFQYVRNLRAGGPVVHCLKMLLSSPVHAEIPYVSNLQRVVWSRPFLGRLLS